MNMSKRYLMPNPSADGQKTFKEFSSGVLPLVEKYGKKLLARDPHADLHEDTVSGTAILLEFDIKAATERFISVTNTKRLTQLGTKELTKIL